jgi:hypothetical protein
MGCVAIKWPEQSRLEVIDAGQPITGADCDAAGNGFHDSRSAVRIQQ